MFSEEQPNGSEYKINLKRSDVMKKYQKCIIALVIVMAMLVGGVWLFVSYQNTLPEEIRQQTEDDGYTIEQSTPSEENGYPTYQHTAPTQDEWYEEVAAGNLLRLTDENYQQLGEFFETISGELKQFVEYLLGHDLLDNLRDEEQGTIILFDLEEAREIFPAGRPDEVVTIYNGALIENLSDSKPLHFFSNNPELFFLLTDIEAQGIIQTIFISSTLDADIWITFEICLTYTEFIWPGGWPASFSYIVGSYDEPEAYGFASLGNNWYMDIMVDLGWGEFVDDDGTIWS